MLLTPVWASLLVLVLACAASSRGTEAMGAGYLGRLLKGHVVALLQIVFLLHQAMLSIDAIGRSVLRVFITKKTAPGVGNSRGSRERAAANSNR